MSTAPATRLTRKEKIAQGLEKLPGNKKKRAADARKVVKKELVYASLTNQAGSPRKYRLVLDLIRNKPVDEALAILKMTPKAAAKPVSRVLLTALADYEDKRPDATVDEGTIVVAKALADQSLVLKRIQPAPQGRAHRIRKRYTRLYVELAPAPETNA